MLPTIIAFIVMLNPFALFLYLDPVRKDLDHRAFLKVIGQATIISAAICISFFFIGDILFEDIFQIDFESFRIFGGIIIFSFAYFFIVNGQRALITLKEDLDDLASEIALPFMVGAGTISLSILMSQNFSYLDGAGVLVGIFVINFTILWTLAEFRKVIERRRFKTAFDKNMEVLLRLNGFFIGAIGVDMVITGVQNIFF
jgi:multiple antibiotic resistance protein